MVRQFKGNFQLLPRGKGRPLKVRQAQGTLYGHYLEFTFGSCRGACAYAVGAYRILAVENERPGNGHFQALLACFRQLARQRNADLIILEVHNTRLYQSLLTKHGFQPVPGTTHALLPVAGNGQCPANLLQTSSGSPALDHLLDTLLDAAAGPQSSFKQTTTR